MRRSGALAVVVLVAVVVLLGVGVRAHALDGVDAAVQRRAFALRSPEATPVVLAVTDLGGGLPRAVVGAVVAVGLVLAHRARAALAVVVVLVVAPLVVLALKHLVGRPRPPRALALVHLGDPSFPSGHATGSWALAVVVVGALTRGTGRVRRRWLRALVVVAAAVDAVAVAASRVYLGVHWGSDVVAGAALGSAIGVAAVGLLVRAGPRQDGLTTGDVKVG